MNRYAAFLRGININGRNKLAMSDLKSELEEMAFSDVSTYLNSGNVTFSSSDGDVASLKDAVEKRIAERFGLEIPVHIVSREELVDILAHAPAWWGTEDKATYDNLIFIMTSDTPEEICEMIGPPSDGLEKIQIYRNILFWTFDRKRYQKCSWWKKTASKGIAEKLTIRTANTVKKLCK
ncbi:MAG: DUF1697 domain-containing protein [Acutalibacteraceae bacterium]